MCRQSKLSRAVLPVAWQLEQRVLLSGSELWVIHGDTDLAHPDDVIVVERAAGWDGWYSIQASVNGTVIGTRLIADVAQVQIVAGLGDDLISIESSMDVPVRVWGGKGNDRMLGDDGPQHFFGGPGHDTLSGAGGDDILVGSYGNDDLEGGDGADALDGDSGNDTLSGGWGTDRLVGNDGNDQLDGGEGRDHLSAGDDRDTLKGGDGRDAMDGGAARDVLYLNWSRDTFSADTLDRKRTDLTKLPMNRIGAEELRDRVLEAGRWMWNSSYDQRVYFSSQYAGFEGRMALAANGGSGGYEPAPADLPAEDPLSSDDHSETNVQVLGVDEADVVKTDGRFIYTVNGGFLAIVDARTLEEVYREEADGTAVGLYLRGDRLTVISYHWDLKPLQIPSGVKLESDSFMYWYGGLYPNEVDEYVKLRVLDVSERAAPAMLEETRVDGWYRDSRAIGDRIYLVTSSVLTTPAPRLVADGPAHVKYESKDSYMRWLSSGGLEGFEPGFTSRGADGSSVSGTLVDGDDLWIRASEPNYYYQEMISVSLLNIGDDRPDDVDATSIMGWSPTLYVSADAMYLTQYGRYEPGVGVLTDIIKLGLGTDAVSLQATGRVFGEILNQFSMDEHEGYFRCVTNQWTYQGQANNLFILDQVGSELRLAGSIEGFAPGERIYSARFTGDRGYVVTYVQVDPLFTLDLSNPLAPKIVGELKIPGFSNYLHPVGDHYLLGLGKIVDANNRPTGVQLSLFDVSDLANPTRTAVYTVSDSDAWSDSIAQYNHHAFAWFPAQGILAFPVQEYRFGDIYTYSERMEVVRVDVEQGTITRLGAVEHEGYGQNLRAIRIREQLFSIARLEIVVTDLDDPANVIGRLDL